MFCCACLEPEVVPDGCFSFVGLCDHTSCFQGFRDPRARLSVGSRLAAEPVAVAGRPEGVDSYDRRNIVAKGMERFELDKFAPPQPDWEILSDRVICVLGANPAPYTLNVRVASIAGFLILVIAWSSTAF